MIHGIGVKKLINFIPNIIIVSEGKGDRNKPRKYEKKDGEIYWCDFDMSRHAIRPGMILFINGLKPVICTICSTDHRGDDWDEYPNVKITRPLRKGDPKLPNDSHVCVNRFRYIKSEDIEILSKIGLAQPENVKEIKEEFCKTNLVNGKLLDYHPKLESLIYPDLESIIADIKEI